MNSLIFVLFLLNFGLKYFACNKTDVLVVTSMKNDLTKSVKKVLDNINNSTEISEKNVTSHPVIAPVNNSSNYSIAINAKKPVPFEGGGFIHVPSVVAPGEKPRESNLSVTSVSTSAKPSTHQVEPESSKTVAAVHPDISVTNNITAELLSKPGDLVNETSTSKVTEERKISARKGVVYEPLPNETKLISSPSSTSTVPLPKVSISTQPTTRLPKPKKPKYAMIIGDHESKERQSFIESPTTGKDYIFPIVLTIMAIPLLVVIVKLIYKRGSEYTERRHYDRMYLIDGMYNAR